jgi:hypothetical protein
MSADHVNAAFEVAGSIATWATFAAIIKDKGYAGMRLPLVAFFTTWGLWNLYFYTHLFLPISLYASIVLTAGNIAVMGAMVYYGRKRYGTLKFVAAEKYRGDIASSDKPQTGLMNYTAGWCGGPRQGETVHFHLAGETCGFCRFLPVPDPLTHFYDGKPSELDHLPEGSH